jgi:TolB-like protein
MKKFLTSIIILILLSGTYLLSQEPRRVAILPYQNMDGNLELNIWNYTMQEKLAEQLMERDPDEFNYKIISIDSIEMVLAQYNLDPNDPEYETDMWNAVKDLQAEYVITGNFIKSENRLIFNTNIIHVKYKLPLSKYKSKDISITIPDDIDSEQGKEAINSAIQKIVESVRPGIL